MRGNSPALLLIGRLGASGLALVSAPIVARAIGPEGRGETAAAIALFALIPIVVGLGLPLEMRRVVAIDNSLASVRQARRLVLFSAILALPAALICWASIFQSFSYEARLAASIGVALTPITLSWICDTSVLVAVRDYRGIAILQLLQPATYLLMVVALWATETAATASVIGAYIASNAVSFVFGLIRVRPGKTGDARRAHALAKGSISFAGGSLAEAASNRLDQVLSLPLLGATQAGLYSVAVTVGFAPLAIAQALGAAAFTSIARSEGRRRQRMINESIRQVASVSLISSLALWLAGPIIVTILFGEAFAGADDAIRITAWVCFVSSIALQASSVLIASGHRAKLTMSQVAGLVLGIGSLILLGPIYGASGAAWAALISATAMATLNVIFSGAAIHSVVPTPFALLAGVRTLARSRED